MANAKRIGWAIYAAGFVIWLFGYVSTGHAAAFDWEGATPRWISSFVPNLEAELGLAFMFDRDPRVVGVFGAANLACDLGDRRVRSCYGSRCQALPV
jgi:hypothetical protein